MGGANYSSVVPKGSYIDIMDFKSPKDLADYLKEVASDDNKYRQYFKYKEKYHIKGHATSFQCSICEYLNRNWDKTQIIPRFDLFWSSKTNCSDGEEVLKKYM